MKVSPFTWLALSFFGYYCAYGVFVPFFPVWLKSQHYDSEVIGIVLAAAYVFRFIGGMFFSARINRPSQLLNALRILALGSALIMAGMNFLSEYFWLLFAAIGLFAMLNSGGMTLSDSLASTWQRQIQLDYGKTRLVGSAAFVIGVTLFGQLINVVGETNIVWILTSILCVYTIIQYTVPTIPPTDEAESAVKNSVTFLSLLKNSTTWRILLAVSFIQGSHAAYYGYSVLYWTNNGLTVSQTGWLWGFAVMAEILLFFFSRRLFQNWKVSSIFYLATLATIIRWGGLALTTNFALLAILQLLHSFTYAAAHYAMIRYITTQPQHHIAKLQGLYNGISNSAAVALLTALSGLIFPISSTWTFVAMLAVSACAFVVMPKKVDAFLLKQS
ncbi:3-phenylpropionate MFS transporter [Rodentibacter caecimuris]|uniref:3-phenylpropionic acid transporter n=1 Tax=Rodentibacter caecimuris TaxID=1796644 RepID=A0ABX3L0F0_9PAST|nr:3-phenylpropionic acid transporter [Rodentibacter heylii]